MIQGLIDENFVELEELQNDANPNFVEETTTLYYRNSSRLIQKKKKKKVKESKRKKYDSF